MSIYLLTDEPVFPDPNEAGEEGLLAVGGDLSPERLLNAYAAGIFPWYSSGQPILWWSPDPRMVLFPENFKRHKNLRRTVNKGIFRVTVDTCFDEVIDHCAGIREGSDEGTWITGEMKSAYKELHRLGFAHSFETWQNGKLAGGLYGVSIGASFFGESMFHLVSDTSKVALWYLVELMIRWDFDMIDVQQETGHLKRMGATPVERKKFLNLLRVSVSKPTKKGSWKNMVK
jgi:leucyl/phenylalanyl-tRNA--protein transferase